MLYFWLLKTKNNYYSILQIKINLKGSDKYVALSSFSMYYTWKNIKSSYKNNKFKMPSLTWSEKLDLPDESYSVSDIQNYFEYTIKKWKSG